jgi:hypothetical protein
MFLLYNFVGVGKSAYWFFGVISFLIAVLIERDMFHRRVRIVFIPATQHIAAAYKYKHTWCLFFRLRSIFQVLSNSSFPSFPILIK